jgi:hypothetical protein
MSIAVNEQLLESCICSDVRLGMILGRDRTSRFSTRGTPEQVMLGQLEGGIAKPDLSHPANAQAVPRAGSLKP